MSIKFTNRMHDYNIIIILQLMKMASNTYKTKLNSLYKAISHLLIVGFGNSLKVSWDIHLKEEQQNLIL